MTGEQQEKGTARLWRSLAQAQDAALEAQAQAAQARDAGELPRGAAAFAVAHVATRTRPRRRLGRLPFAMAMAMAMGAVAVVLVVSSATRRRTLSVQLGSSVPRGEAIPSLVADARNDLPLRFSDGSTVTFRAGSSGQLEKLNTAGAELVLVRGTLQAHVIHAETTSWTLHAGPYRVRVTGTRFGLSWRSERLELSLYEGSVMVDGAVLGAGVPVRAGQRLTVASGVVRIEPLGGVATLALATPSARQAPGREGRDFGGARPVVEPLSRTGQDVGHDVPAATVEDAERGARAGTPSGTDDDAPGVSPSPPRAVRTRPAGARGAHGRHLASRADNAALDDQWLALADRGAYREALQAAKRIGWASLCRRLDARRLLMLADVARYSGAPVPAHRAFQALVKRFPDDRLAADAVFSLGRLAFERGRPAEAARWFHHYVSDWPKGPLAEQAAGRLLESTIRLQDPDATHAAARAYLAGAPHGAQAALARGVLADAADGSPAP